MTATPTFRRSPGPHPGKRYTLNVYTFNIYEGQWEQLEYSGPGTARQCGYQKQFRFKSKEVEIFRRGKDVILREKDEDMSRAFDLLAGLPDDFEIRGRDTDLPQQRKGL